MAAGARDEGHEDVTLRSVGLPRGDARTGEHVAAHPGIVARLRADHGAEMHEEMVLQVAAQRRRIGDDCDAAFGKVRGRPDAGLHQESRRVDGAGGDDRLARADRLHRAVGAADEGADRPPALEQDSRNLRLREDSQVRSSAHRGREIGAGGGDSAGVGYARGDREDAVHVGRVEIGEEAELKPSARRRERPGEAGPSLRRHAADRNRTVAPVLWRVDVAVGLELAEIGKHVVPGPARSSARRPAVIVGGEAAERPHAHHRRAAAHQPRLRIGAAAGAARATACSPGQK